MLTDGRAVLKTGGPFQFCRGRSALRTFLCVANARKSVPPSPLARRFTAFRGPDNRPAARLAEHVLDRGMTKKKAIMTMVHPISVASDRTMAALVSALDIEFGRGAGAALAHRYFDAEPSDFHWQARVQERWIGTYESADDHGLELYCVRILGTFNGVLFVAVMIVDGDGNAHDMTGKQAFRRANDARRAFADA
ncbi:hypothetical protein [Sphingomonas sp. OK281]|uniref:hypothetical protein n=1 Tax=Sphingomonas sp. OK281 TaxID=1881067 RepID=UPI0008EBF61A|nr:hypothetical protein [Sphingomonas sp. OK281]SFO41697.1 hypothetical protein SAMN05428984_4072 [Sphingomonas sp. OK281]